MSDIKKNTSKKKAPIKQPTKTVKKEVEKEVEEVKVDEPKRPKYEGKPMSRMEELEICLTNFTDTFDTRRSYDEKRNKVAHSRLRDALLKVLNAESQSEFNILWTRIIDEARYFRTTSWKITSALSGLIDTTTARPLFGERHLNFMHLIVTTASHSAKDLDKVRRKIDIKKVTEGLDDQKAAMLFSYYN